MPGTPDAGGSGSADPSPGEPTVICVIGAPRSGTSLTARILNLAGVYLGPEDDLVPAGPLNPRGFWESRPIAALNERLLESLGGTIRNPPNLPAGWETSPGLAAERREARLLLRDIFGDKPLWGWKDPRASLTLPFWRLAAPTMRFVICVRNPLDSATSARAIEHPIAFREARIFATWLRYTAAALANTSDSRRIVISYDDYADRGRETIERLWRFAGNGQAPTEEAFERLESAIDGSLFHHSTSPVDVLRDDHLPPEVAAFYLVAELLSTAGRGEPGEQSAITQLEAAVDLYARRHR